MKAMMTPGPAAARAALQLAAFALSAAALLTPRTAAAEMQPMHMMDDEIHSYFLVDRFEYRVNSGANTLDWDAEGWIGGDYNKLWLKSEGKKVVDGGVEDAEVQVLYSRLITPFWDFQAGIRYDPKPDPTRGFAVFGVEGLAPLFYEVEAAAFISHEGDVSARINAEYDLLITQRLILQPRVEMNFAAQEVRKLGIGSGLNDVELGLRLRYEIVRKVAPYVGVSWLRKVGRTADYADRAGDDIDTLSFVTGIRFWF
jgi:copper resistance protein B